MVNHDKVRRIRSDINQLLNELTPYWPADKIRLVREEVGCGEYSDAIMNIIAIAVSNHIEVTDEQYETVGQLVYDLKIVPEVKEMILHIQHNEKEFASKQVG